MPSWQYLWKVETQPNPVSNNINTSGVHQESTNWKAGAKNLLAVIQMCSYIKKDHEEKTMVQNKLEHRGKMKTKSG
jgi:hypothetical protein